MKTPLIALCLLAGPLLSPALHAAETKPLPLDAFLREPEVAEVTLSPSGDLLAVSVPMPDRSRVVVLKTETLAPVASWDLGENNFVDDLRWANDERVVFKLASRYGSVDYARPNDGLFSLVLGNKEMDRYITVNRDDVVRGFPPGQPGWIYIEREGTVVNTHPQLLKLNLANGATTRHVRGDADYGDFVLDPDGHVRWFIGENRDLTRVVLQRDGDAWKEVFRGPGHALDEVPLLAPDAGSVYVGRSTAGGPQAVERLDPATGKYTPVSADARYDADALITAADRKTVLGVTYEGLRPRIHWVLPDHPEARELRSLEKSFGGLPMRLIDRSRDGRLMLIGIHSDQDPGQVYLFDRESKQAKFLFANRAWIDPETMATQRAVTVKARDGKDIDAYLWLPAGREPKDLPLVVRPHGGPHGVRETFGFDGEAQLLASRGYAVLTVNFRGSAGYGQAFERAGYREWGGAMIDDLTDATRWAIGEGLVDASRVCIYGASYGGYAALMSTVREPELYRCAVGYAGMYDMGEMLSHDRGESMLLGRYFGEVYPKADEERDAQSPAKRAAAIRAAVMLAHGSKDMRIPLAQFDRMAKALRKAGRPAEVELMESGEGHGFSDPANVRKFYETMLAFLDRHIGRAPAAAPASP